MTELFGFLIMAAVCVMVVLANRGLQRLGLQTGGSQAATPPMAMDFDEATPATAPVGAYRALPAPRLVLDGRMSNMNTDGTFYGSSGAGYPHQ